MSYRVLKKLQQQQISNELSLRSDNDKLPSDTEDTEFIRGKGNLNPFDLLNQQNTSNSDENEDEQQPEVDEDDTNNTNVSSVLKKKKKRKKKPKVNSNEKEEKQCKENSIATEIVKENVPATYTNGTIDNLFKIELRNLSSQNEMRKKFGKRIVKVDNKRSRSKLTLKSTYMVTARETWPPLKKNIISMKIVEAPKQNPTTTNQQEKQLQWFAFEHSEYYRQIQMLFYNAVERTDSDFIISLIRRSPYHVDSLIQLSEICKMTEDYSLAGELIERALYLLETSLHPSFSLTARTGRLDYRRQENRAFFIVLFKHAQYLEARACTQTAFEISKLIFNLNPETDPLAIILVIDYYAIRCKQYKWLVEFYENYQNVRNLCQLPNMAYSYALALYCLNKDCEKANDTLHYALLMFPGFLCPLLEELNKPIGSRLSASSYFSTTRNRQPPALEQLVALYLCRAKVIWRQDDILLWVEKIVNKVLDCIEGNSQIISKFNYKRNLRYVTPPRAILRHVVLADFKEKVPLAPFISEEKDHIVMYDPLPPPDSFNLYERKTSRNNTTVSTNGSLSMFFHSLLPSFNINTRNIQQQQENPIQAQINDNPLREVAAPDAAPNPIDRDANHIDGAYGIEVLAEGNANSMNHAIIDQAEVAQQLVQLGTALTAAVDESTLARQGRGRNDTDTYREFTQSLNSFVDAMRDVLNFSIPAFDLQDTFDADSSDDS